MSNTIRLPKIEDPRGNLSFIEFSDRGICPFEIKRTYWIYDVPTGQLRHGRALRTTREMIVALSGSFDVVLDFGNGQPARRIFLNRCDIGLIVEPGTWRTIENFAGNSVAMVLASAPYDENDYIRDYSTFNAEYR